MDLVDDLDTELAVAFLVERRYQQKLNSEEALELIGRVRDLLETAENITRTHPMDERLTRFAH